MCDVGAFAGETLGQWIAAYGDNLKKYYGFEPNRHDYQKLIRKIEESGKRGMATAFPVGLGDQNASLNFIECGKASRVDANGDTIVQIARLDDLKIEVSGKLCVKMDIEGFELEALRGAEETIKKYKPELAICIYHKLEDTYKIPEYIKRIVPEYKCVIRGGSHAVCYATAGA
jgi:FkbM family methyltransferase